MPNQAVAQHVAHALAEGALVHPGTDQTGPIPLPLPMFRTTGMPTEQANHFAQQAGLPHGDIATLVGEALVHTIETDGDHELISKTELAQLRAIAANTKPQRYRQPHFHCNCGSPLFKTNITDLHTDQPKLNGPALFAALAQLSPECALGHQPITHEDH